MIKRDSESVSNAYHQLKNLKEDLLFEHIPSDIRYDTHKLSKYIRDAINPILDDFAFLANREAINFCSRCGDDMVCCHKCVEEMEQENKLRTVNKNK